MPDLKCSANAGDTIPQTTQPKQTTSYLGLYRAGMSTPEHRQHITVARHHLIEDAIDHLRRSMGRKSKHSFMFIGPRGSGKTHLLSLIEDQIAAHDDLAAHFVVARFPEESNRTLSFADFLLGLVEILRHQLPTEVVWGQLHEKLATESDDTIIVNSLVPALRMQNRERNRTVLVMLENLNEMFSKQMRKGTDVGAMRKFFMDDNGCQLIATAPVHFDAITSVSEPFFDFFDVQVVDLLDKNESIELVRRNLEWEQRTDLLASFSTLRPKIMALHDMTGGSPRLTLMLYELIVHDSVTEVRQQLMQLLDRVTPFYQERLRDLAPLERAVLETISLMRENSQPKTPARIAANMRISQQQASSLLKRMTDSRYLKHDQHPTDKRSRLYSIREGFFDIWMAMNLSRRDRHRLPVLVECLEKFYPQWEERERKRQEYRERWGSVNAQAGLDLLSEIGSVEERTLSKLDLAQRHAITGDTNLRTKYFDELQSLPLDSMGKWIVHRVESSEVTTNYLDEFREMIQCWTLHRSGNLEAFAGKLAAIGTQLTYKNFSEAKIDFLREHMAMVTDSQTRNSLRSNMGRILHELARWPEAEIEFRAAVEDAEALGEVEMISSNLNNLGVLLNDTDRSREAEPILRRAMSIEEQRHSTEQPQLAVRLNNLARVFERTNRLAEAESLTRRALAIDMKHYAVKSPRIACRQNNLAVLLSRMGDMAEAELLMHRALATDEAVFGSDAPAVARDLSNLATVYMQTSRLDEAEPLIRRSLAINEASYGPRHPSVANDLNHLGLLLQARNCYAEAETMLRNALNITEECSGDDHPNVAYSLVMLANLLKAAYRPDEAIALLTRAVAIMRNFETRNGFKHPRFGSIEQTLTLLQSRTPCPT